MTVSVTLIQTFNTFSDDVSDLFYILLLGLTWFKVDWYIIKIIIKIIIKMVYYLF